MLGRTSGDFCDLDLHFVVVILHLLFFFIHIFFSTSFLTLPWTIARFLDLFCTFSPAHCTVIRYTFIFQPFRYLLTTNATGFEWTFFTHWCFLPYAPSRQFWHIPDIFAQPAFIKVSLGARSYFLESCKASYWSFIQLKFVFIHVNIVKVLLGVKTLVRSAAILFSNHENIKQQPN